MTLVNENIVQVLNPDGSISYEELPEDNTENSATTSGDPENILSQISEQSEDDTVSDTATETTVEVPPGTATLDTIHTDLQMILFIILFIYCSGQIKSGFRHFRKWHKGE